MRKRIGRVARSGVLILLAVFLNLGVSHAQEENEIGRSIGKVSTNGDLIVVELDDGALGSKNLFNLVGRTLHFIPDRSAYRVETGALQWDADYGPELSGAEVTLHQFDFPFSGKRWSSFLVGASGSAEGVRSPDVQHSQRKFNTGIVVVVEHGKTPSRELIERANEIRRQWTYNWETVTGHRASMTTNPR